MSYQISFKYPGLAQKPKEEWRVVERIARLICNNPLPHVQESGYRWALDSSNDWKMGFDPQTEEYIISYRYGGGGNIPRMEQLRSTILWRLGIEDHNSSNVPVT
ncbi:MAG: hypothetical protein G01um101448_348 [Parcubacteria group bacterium Gr01-1014_48]|nr:MAG: hypothetical protein Greene041614_1150 [Parcubacteria group bacterium Greene0416_14]TSC74108.1 MAG: hypothetical protein G01um101448_348 [Parcubacteria group bacterium Gr01-1014_48]TSC99933.1 MAG: hypothetical protein Greene101415_1028 [Parcubacteria group bacterium Greene1014_15]TSD07701.1 MAG: hypothetical protein Greene07144_795 [Parcubacteria group bacterium Greene0714_4]